MSAPILATKLYIPPSRPGIVLRPRLVERLNEGLANGYKLTLISASAGFGKTTLVTEWIGTCRRPFAWLSLDERDNDPARFITYLIKALQTLAFSKVEGSQAGIGEELLAALRSPQPLQFEVILTTLLNEVSAIPGNFLLILDDYHLIDSPAVDQSLTFLIEHQPPQMHLVITTREDPSLPLARLRARGQLTELRTADLRFTSSEAAEFLNRVMGLNLPEEDVTALESRAEGWVAGLQLAAISMQGLADAASFIQSFTGSHRFVLDYLLEEVLHRQSVEVQAFLLRTSILERLCGSLCDAVLGSSSGEKTLEYLERANLFIIPLDNERRWYRYHHLFGDLLRKRLQQGAFNVAELHTRASSWYEDNGLEVEAFHHAAAANDVERAARLMENKEMPLHLRSVLLEVLTWLESLPATVLNAWPALWYKQAQLLLLNGQTTRAEEKLQATEAALATLFPPGTEADDQTRDLIGKIAAIRSNLGLAQNQAETILVQARRALEYLHPNNLGYRSSVTRDMGFAYYLQGNRAAAGQAFADALSIARASGEMVSLLLATIGLADIQEMENKLRQTAENYQRILQPICDYSPLNAAVVYRRLAEINYEWNDLDTAEQYGEQSMRLALQYDQVIGRIIRGKMFLARLKLARDDVDGAEAMLAQAEQSARQHQFTHQLPEVAAFQVLVLLRRGNLTSAARLAGMYDIPISQARVLLAQGDPSAASTVLEAYRQQMETRNFQDERLRAVVLQAVAFQACDKKDNSMQTLSNALTIAEPGGFIRLFVDEGAPMAELLSVAAAQGIRPGYVSKLLAAFEMEPRIQQLSTPTPNQVSLIDPLSPRELEVLGLIARGFSNEEICKRLFLALNTVKGHNRRIFDKLHVQRRTEAIVRARELGLI
jgi:LuxR family maltose regulon positive regulatory protein